MRLPIHEAPAGAWPASWEHRSPMRASGRERSPASHHPRPASRGFSILLARLHPRPCPKSCRTAPDRSLAGRAVFPSCTARLVPKGQRRGSK